ncbi:MAG: hypothetical protein LBC61_02010 [Candidatus Peribacteria bacterium]|jgi:hypothetical protein|nr:hypothetical protein [Candidatus Peribacteria bacterium]
MINLYELLYKLNNLQMADKKLNLNSLLSKENSEKVDKTEEKETNINPETSVENPTINDYPDSDNFVI